MCVRVCVCVCVEGGKRREGVMKEGEGEEEEEKRLILVGNMNYQKRKCHQFTNNYPYQNILVDNGNGTGWMH